jgi:Dynein heavy chain C-terminal domain
MQKVIKTVYTNLCDLKLAIDGTIVMSQYLSESLDAMYDARIPERWQKVCSIHNFHDWTLIDLFCGFVMKSDLVRNFQLNLLATL